MSNLLSLSELKYKALGRRRYRFSAGDEVVVSVDQIEGSKARGRLGRMFAENRDYSRTVLRGVSADGAVLFFVKRTGTLPLAPVIVRAPDGSLFGCVENNFRHEGDVDRGYGRVLQMRWRLLDASNVVACNAERRLRSEAMGDNAPIHADDIDYANSLGVPVARFDGRRLKLERQLPEPQHVVLVASLIAFDLLDGA